MNELRLVKFQTLIEDISKAIMKVDLGRIHRNLSLKLIFDFDECNEYAKTILLKSSLYLYENPRSRLPRWLDTWNKFASLRNANCDVKTRFSAAKLFIELCKYENNKQACYKFIFWALLVLTVDKSKAQEYLSLICDFAKMLKITNDEFEDIIHVIKCVYNVEDKNYAFKTETIPNIFDGVLNLYSD